MKRIFPITLAFAFSMPLLAAEKENKQSSTSAAPKTSLISTAAQQPGSPAAPAQIPSKSTINEQVAQAPSQSGAQPRDQFQEQLEQALKHLKATFPKEKIPGLAQRQEQVAQLGFLARAFDTSTYHCQTHEGYLRKHVLADTLRLVLPTADLQRAKFGHAANELARKAQERSDRNLIKRMGELVASSDAYGIGLNPDDLHLMREIILKEIGAAVGTLILLDNKSAGIQNKIAAVTTIDSTTTPQQTTSQVPQPVILPVQLPLL